MAPARRITPAKLASRWLECQPEGPIGIERDVKVRSTSQAQMAFVGLAGSTVHGLLRHQVQGAHFNVRLPCANCLSANWEYTVRTPLASVLGLHSSVR